LGVALTGAALAVGSAVQHVLTKTQFDAAMNPAKGAKVLGKTQHFCLHAGLSIEQQYSSAALVGVVLPKRWAKSAVRRNLLRRAIYQQAQGLPQLQSLPDTHTALVVVRLTCGFAQTAFRSARSKVLQQAVNVELQNLFLNAQSAFERFVAQSMAKTSTAPEVLTAS
jgi:ribonuclease P protein component